MIVQVGDPMAVKKIRDVEKNYFFVRNVVLAEGNNKMLKKAGLSDLDIFISAESKEHAQVKHSFKVVTIVWVSKVSIGDVDGELTPHTAEKEVAVTKDVESKKESK